MRGSKRDGGSGGPKGVGVSRGPTLGEKNLIIKFDCLKRPHLTEMTAIYGILYILFSLPTREGYPPLVLSERSPSPHLARTLALLNFTFLSQKLFFHFCFSKIKSCTKSDICSCALELISKTFHT